ncbi:hypothetical protein D3C72_1053990 [compost metagenome]
MWHEFRQLDDICIVQCSVSRAVYKQEIDIGCLKRTPNLSFIVGPLVIKIEGDCRVGDSVILNIRVSAEGIIVSKGASFFYAIFELCNNISVRVMIDVRTCEGFCRSKVSIFWSDDMNLRIAIAIVGVLQN